MHQTRTIPLAILAISLTAAPALAGTCPTDFDGDGATGFTDLTNLLGAWGPCTACPQDLDAGGDVGFTDLTTLLGAWGPCPVDQFEYPVYENMLAVAIGHQFLNASNELVLPQATYDRINRDLELMEAARPEITGAPHQGPWAPFRLLLVVDQTLPQEVLDATIAYYQGELTDWWFDGNIRGYDFPQGANPNALIPILEAIPAVESAEPDNLIGLPGALTVRWTPTIIGGNALRWTVGVGWDTHPHLGDFCTGDFTPCECFSTYEFVILADGTLTLTNLTSVPSPFNPDGDCTGYPPTP